MKDNYNELVHTFKKQLELTKNLIALADNKMEAIKSNDTVAIMEITNREEMAAREIIQLEKDRDLYIKEIEKIEQKKLSSLSDYVGLQSPDKAVGINLVSEELKYNLEILKEKNSANQTLMNFVLEQIEIANNLIVGDRMPSTYSNTKFNQKNYSKSGTGLSSFDSKY